MMKIILLAAILITFSTTYGQVYLQQGLGYAFKKNGDRNVSVNIHAGYQVNKAILTQGIALVEYNQRVLIGSGINPIFLGGRIGYGYNIDESVIIALWGAAYYRLVASGVKGVNYWVQGYGMSVTWKSITLDITNADIYQLSIGCRYLFD